MLKYDPQLKSRARTLRTNLTDAERALWNRLRAKQILGVQFYRQRPIGNYIVDFYAPVVALVIEVDGAQHLDSEQARYDWRRSGFLQQLGLKVMRFDDRQVLLELDTVVEAIFYSVSERLE